MKAATRETTIAVRKSLNGRIALAMLMFAAGAASHAQNKNCIELQTAAETEQAYTDEQGRAAKRLVPAGKIVPGDEVVWTITAKNVCDSAADNIVIANPVPEHMSYVANSAIGVGTTITYSLDGQLFKPATALNVSAADGSSRPARADEIRAIRWTYAAPFAKGATAFVRYRATVN
jgi:uncharacterized repeat protein (TIGR01451 family)